MTPTQAQIDAAQNDLFKRYGIAIGTDELRTALTAAAEVDRVETVNQHLIPVVEATIERCAQVAEKWADDCVLQECEGVAAAIRALSTEKP